MDLWTPIEFQKRLIEHGYSLPQYGADGFWGDESSDACARWFRDGTDLGTEAQPPAQAGIVPIDWMDNATMLRVVVHWTAGSYSVSSTDLEHYHVVVAGTGELHRGDHPISDNSNTSDNDYAAHTKNCNTQSIGISAACMAGAIENPFSPGSYPLLKMQWETLAAVAADLCNHYRIKVTPQTVLQHGEVQANLGVTQSGKWDIMTLPWAPTMNAGDAFRDEVIARL